MIPGPVWEIEKLLVFKQANTGNSQDRKNTIPLKIKSYPVQLALRFKLILLALCRLTKAHNSDLIMLAAIQSISGCARLHQLGIPGFEV